MTQSLLIPMEGPLERHPEPHDGPFALLEALGAKGPLVQVSITGHDDGKYLCFHLMEVPPQNNRARHLLSLLSGLHFQITGPAVLTGLTDEELTTLMEQS